LRTFYEPAGADDNPGDDISDDGTEHHPWRPKEHAAQESGESRNSNNGHTVDEVAMALPIVRWWYEPAHPGREVAARVLGGRFRSGHDTSIRSANRPQRKSPRLLGGNGRGDA
jgi:hypothetical protein